MRFQSLVLRLSEAAALKPLTNKKTGIRREEIREGSRRKTYLERGVLTVTPSLRNIFHMMYIQCFLNGGAHTMENAIHIFFTFNFFHTSLYILIC